MNKIIDIFAEVKAPESIPKVTLNGNTILNVVNVVLALSGAIAVAFIIFAGIQFILSNGDPAKVKQSREMIIYALVGIAIVAIAFPIVNYVIGSF